MTSYPTSQWISGLGLGLALLAAAPAQAEIPQETIEVVGVKRPDKPKMEVSLPPYNLNSQVFNFPTGLRIIMQSDSSHPIASVFTIVDHGHSDDAEGREGSAHFVEHIWFRSQHGELPPVMDVIQDMGALFNATTRADWTDYRTVASTEFLPLMMRMESLRLTEFYRGVTEEHIDIEREVIRNEWRRRNEQSYNLLFDYLGASVYPEGHPYHSRSTHESLDNIRLADLQAYVDAYYKPENATITVVGDFDPDDALTLIFKNFDLKLLHPDLEEEHLIWAPDPDIEDADPTNPDHLVLSGVVDPNNSEQAFQFADDMEPRLTNERPPVPELGSDEVVREKAPLDNTTVALGWSLPAGYRDDQVALQMVGNFASRYLTIAHFYDLGGYKSRTKDPGCFVQSQKVNSTLMCFVEVTDSNTNPERVADWMQDQFAEMWNPENQQFMERSFALARVNFMADTLQSLDLVASHFGGRAEDIGVHAHFTGSPQAHSAALQSVVQLSSQQVIDLTSEYLKRERAAVLIIEPLDKEEVDKTGEASSYHGVSEGDAVINSSNTLALATNEAIADTFVAPDLSELRDIRLSNGLRVVVLPHGEAPLVQATLMYHGGRSSGEPGLSYFVSRFTTEDSQEPLQVAGEWSQILRSTSWELGMRGPAGNLPDMLWMLREDTVTTRPYMTGRDQRGKAGWIRSQRKGLIGQWGTAGWHQRQLVADHLYPNSVRHHVNTWEDIENWEDWGPEDIEQYLASHLNPGNATLIVVGAVDGDEALQHAVDHFGDWQPRNGAPAVEVPLPPTPPIVEETKVLVFDDPKRTQTQINQSCRLNFEGIEDARAVNVLGELMGERTFSTLRVKEGLAYSPRASASASPDGVATLTFYSLAVNQGVGRTVEFFREMTARGEAGDLQPELITLHKLRAARSDGIAAQSTAQMTSALAHPLFWRAGWDDYLQTGEHIANVDAAQLQRLIQGCGARSITTLEGPIEIIEPQLQEQGIEYEIVDWEDRGDALLKQHDPKAYKKKMKAKAKAEKRKAREEAAGDGVVATSEVDGVAVEEALPEDSLLEDGAADVPLND